MERAVFIAVRRLRWGFLIQAVAGNMSVRVATENLRRLADFASVSGEDREAREIMEDVSTMEEEWKPTES